MAYWAGTAPVSVIDIDTGVTGRRRDVTRTEGPVYVNGVRLIAKFGTGTAHSMMTLRGAARAGIKPGDPGVVSTGYVGGASKRLVRSWIGPVQSFKIGQAEIRNTRMRIGDIQLGDADLVLGADFFLSHHIFVSNRQEKLYLTYNGGPVFDLSQTPKLVVEPPPPSATSGAAVATEAPSSAAPNPPDAEPTDAAGFARRGAGFAARNALAPAIADLSKAIELAPTVADYYDQRGLYYRRTQQPALAMADFDAALKLKADDVPALVARAALRLAAHETAQAIQDLEAADKASAKEDDVHFQLANLYAVADLPTAAIDQYSLWIDAHDADSRLPQALNGRCWQRALSGVDLDKALKDCNRAIRGAPKIAALFDSRGLVHLRLGDLDRAIADYDAALAIDPKLGWSLYGRGLAEKRKGLTAQSAADISAAVALNPKLPEELTKRGLT
jgi:tetratricopeptide (TPR) repeat protein